MEARRINVSQGPAVSVRIEKVESGGYVMWVVKVVLVSQHDPTFAKPFDVLGPFPSELEANVAVKAVMVGAQAVQAARPSCAVCN